MKVAKEKIKKCNITLYEYLRMHAKENGSKKFLVTEDESITYFQCYSKVNGLIKVFKKAGICKGTVVALRATRCPQTVMTVIALGALGAIAALTDPHKKIKEFIGESGVDISPKFFLTNENYSEDISEREGWQLICGDNYLNIEFTESEEVENMPCSRAEDSFLIIFTSGSTGRAKAVQLSHKNVVANPVDAMPLFEQDEKDTAISLLPLDHVFGFAVVACAAYCGHGVVFPKNTETDYVLKCLEFYKITVIYSVPSFFLALLNEGKNRKYNLNSLRLGLMAGAPFTAAQLKYIEGELGLRLMPGYGMSECVGISTMNYDASVEERAVGVGKLYPMTEVSFARDGEICVRGATLMQGYYGDEIATREAIDKDGWLHTGDLGYLDENGFLHINGRKKDIIIRNGNNISAADIERKILSLPDVKDVCVVGIADEICGEVPCVLLVAEKPVELTSVLNKIELPKKVIYVKSVPLTSSGKPDKQKAIKYFM